MKFGMNDIPTIQEQRGSLSVMELGEYLPFELRRIFYIYDIPRDTVRGAHALKSCHQFLIPMNGSLTVRTEHRGKTSEFRLKSRHQGLYLLPEIWRELESPTADCCCLVLASEPYDADGYYRDYEAWKTAIAEV